MPTYKANPKGETVYGSEFADFIYGDKGDDILYGLGGNDEIYGAAGNDSLVGGAGADKLDGGDGTDTVNYFNSLSAISVSLLAGSGIGGDAQGDTFISIENLVGSNFNDVIVGNAGANILMGLAGDDVLAGGAGADVLYGGDGVDIADYVTSSAGVTVNLATGTGLGGDAQGDTLNTIENIMGSAFNDVLIGNAGANALYGLAGDDVLTGGAGGDTLDGGNGIDTADYAASTAGVTVNLAVPNNLLNNLLNPMTFGGDAAGDYLTNIENVTGSAYNDALTGDAKANTLSGGAGNDALSGGDGDDRLIGGLGSDALIGGAGIDVADYSASAAGVTVNLATGVGTGGDAQGDTLKTIENLTGSAFADTLTGDANANTLTAGAGNDYVDGNEGNDVIYGGDGDDTLTGNYGTDKMYGESGNDTFLAEWDEGNGDYYNGGDGIDTYKIDGTIFQNYALQIDLATGTSQYHDTFISVENLIGASANDAFYGDAGRNQLWGRGGDDVLDGRGGNDDVFGEDGNDSLAGGAGADKIDGGSGVDTADYSTSLSGVTVNLATGAGLGGDAQGDTLVAIENVIGSAFNDRLVGDAGNNMLDGGAGNDALAGGAGADALIGGAGIDTADYAASAAGVTANLATGVGTGGDAQGDTLKTIENLTGSAFADVLSGDAASNTLDGGAGNDVLAGGLGSDALIGGAGIDVADYSASAAGVTVNLATGVGTGGDAQGDTLKTIENLTGSAFADTLTGDANANTLTAGAGNDYVDGNEGNDVIYGGDGDDTLTGNYGTDKMYGESGNDTFLAEWDEGNGDYYNGGDGIDTYKIDGTIFQNYALQIDLATGTSQYHDTFISVENLIGASANDAFYGDAGRNQLWGRGGDDVLDGRGGNDDVFGEDGNDSLAGGAGADKIDGGSGVDTADYSTSLSGVTVNLATGAGLGGDAQGDTLFDIENLRGSRYGDVLIGNAGNNKLEGGAGDDTLVGGAGADVIDGGDGLDTASYAGSSAGININLFTNTFFGGDADGDFLTGIENITGSEFNDTLAGNATANVLAGGAGVDTLDYAASNAGVTVNLDSNSASGGFAEGDVISGFENLVGTAFDDQITGNAAANILNGGVGNDMLQGFAGDDTLQGGDGNDRLYGGAGADILNGGSGVDTADYRYATGGVTVSLLAGTGFGNDAQGDTLTGIENLAGSNFDDVLTGDAGKNRLVGNEGADKLYGGAGDDMFDTGGGYDFVDGGSGVDTVTYDDSWGAVVVNLATGKGSGAEAANDTYMNVENVEGSAFGDVLTGDANVNRLNGMDGNDTLNGGGGNDVLVGGTGADVLNGGDGDQDAASYQEATSGVVVNLALGGSGGDAAGDTFAGVEYVYGSNFNDQITGDGAINRLTGGQGDDRLDGAAGNDYLLGEAGNDTLIGGLGADVFVFDKSFGHDTIDDFWAGAGRTDRVWITGTDIHNFDDVLSHSVESGGNVTFTINANDSITFTGLSLAQFTADDFIFA